MDEIISNNLINYELKIQDLFEKIKIQQDLFFEKNNRYFQLLKTGSDTGVEMIPDLSKKAVGEKEILPIIPFSDTLPFRIEVHEHFDPIAGRGFTIYLNIKILDTEYGRSIGQGNGFTQNWHQIIRTTI